MSSEVGLVVSKADLASSEMDCRPSTPIQPSDLLRRRPGHRRQCLTASKGGNAALRVRARAGILLSLEILRITCPRGATNHNELDTEPSDILIPQSRVNWIC